MDVEEDFLLKQYVNYLHFHLMESKKIEDIIQGLWVDHQARRFLMMYVLQDRDTFYYYYQNRYRFGLGFLFNQICTAMFSGTSMPVKKKITQSVGIKKYMIDEVVSKEHVMQFEKELHSYLWFKNKGKYVIGKMNN